MLIDGGRKDLYDTFLQWQRQQPVLERYDVGWTDRMVQPYVAPPLLAMLSVPLLLISPFLAWITWAGSTWAQSWRPLSHCRAGCTSTGQPLPSSCSVRSRSSTRSCWDRWRESSSWPWRFLCWSSGAATRCAPRGALGTRAETAAADRAARLRGSDEPPPGVHYHRAGGCGAARRVRAAGWRLRHARLYPVRPAVIGTGRHGGDQRAWHGEFTGDGRAGLSTRGDQFAKRRYRGAICRVSNWRSVLVAAPGATRSWAREWDCLWPPPC